VLGVDE